MLVFALLHCIDTCGVREDVLLLGREDVMQTTTEFQRYLSDGDSAS